MGTSDRKKTGHREITTHVSIHTIHLDGLRELYRHFLRLPDGAVVEVSILRTWVLRIGWSRSLHKGGWFLEPSSRLSDRWREVSLEISRPFRASIWSINTARIHWLFHSLSGQMTAVLHEPYNRSLIVFLHFTLTFGTNTSTKRDPAIRSTGPV